MKTRYNNFDLLRLFLAIEVVCRHVHGGLGSPAGPWLLNAVPTFVCLSGLLIPGSFEGSQGWGHFAWKRVLRVGPAFLAALFFVACAFGLKPAAQTLIPYITAGLVMSGYDAALWSLMVEEILYASHALLRIRRWWNAETIATIAVICTIFAMCHVRPEVMRLFQCAAAYSLGNLAYLNASKVSKLNWKLTSLAAGLAIVAFQFTSITPIMLCGSILTILALRGMPQFKWKIPDTSYGIYIYHEPILLAISIKLGLRGTPALEATLGITIAAAIASWYLIEERALKLKNRPWQLPKRLPGPEVAEVAA